MLLRRHKLDALVGPTMPPTWKIDAINGDQIAGGDAGSLAAVAGYPHLSVPMGMVKGLPVGLSFIGPKWSDALMLRLGYAFEQARGALPRPRFLRSIEEGPELAPHLLPARRRGFGPPPSACLLSPPERADEFAAWEKNYDRAGCDRWVGKRNN